MEKIEKRFGNPKQYAAEYLSLCEASDIDKKLNHSKKVRITILISFLILILLFIVTMICIIKHNEATDPARVYVNVSEESKNEKTN